MNPKRKILVPIFNRAHYGRLRPVLNAIKNHPNLDLKIIVGVPAAYGYFLKNIINSRPRSWFLALPWYMLARIRSFLGKKYVFKNDFLARNLLADGFELEAYVPIFFDGGKSETMAKTAGFGLEKLTDEIRKIKPDVVFVNADRFEMMAVAMVASYLNIPIAHNEGGDMSGTIDESVRHAITKLAHIHFTSTESSRNRVIQMGENPEKVFNVGSPAIDAIANVDFKIRPDVFSKLDISKPYLLILAHPVTTISSEENFKFAQNLISAIKEISIPKIILGSNIDAGSDALGGVIKNWLEKEKPNNVFFTKTLHPDDFYKYLKYTACAVGNSSSFIREGAYFGTPVVLLGSRQNNRERGDNILEVIDNQKDSLRQAILTQINRGKFPVSNIFGGGDSALKIVDVFATVDLDIQKVFHEIFISPVA
ncbi:MAG: UDP-N-acetylglucosamine 2-epimerase [bacterium]|nr:UDP-N-acetylglucosamine 2-epimerase [bacterium]